MTDGEEQRKAALRKVDLELDEADELVRCTFHHTLFPLMYDFRQISQMEIEVQGIPQSLRSLYQGRVKAAKADLQRFKKQSKDTLASLARSDLLGPRAGGPMATSDEPYGTSDRTRLLAGTELLEDGSRRLADSQRIALETEEQGADILRSLRGQREQIVNARDTVCIIFHRIYGLSLIALCIASTCGYLYRPRL